MRATLKLKERKLIMNAKELFDFLSTMSDEIKEQTEVLILSTKQDNERLISEEADFLSSELECVDKFHAEEFGYAIKSREFAFMQKIASGSILCDNEYIDELKRTYEDCLRHEIKTAMIEKMRKSGIKVPEGI